jgi:hypothetical protein
MATRAWRNSAYDSGPRFAVRKKDQSGQSEVFKGNLSVPPGIPPEDGEGYFMHETQERAYALNHGLMREVGMMGVHSNRDQIPTRSMANDGVFAARPDRGTTYMLDWQLQPAYPFHPMSTMAYTPRPMENMGHIDPLQRPFAVDTYQSQSSLLPTGITQSL